MAAIPFQTAFGKHRVVNTDTGSLSMTDPSFADECDINFLMSKYQSSELIPHVTRYQGQYADFSDSIDYLTAQNIILEANDAFASLPAHIRNRFDNDPAQFLDFVHDPNSREEMKALGLLTQQFESNINNEAQPISTNDEPLGE